MSTILFSQKRGQHEDQHAIVYSVLPPQTPPNLNFSAYSMLPHKVLVDSSSLARGYPARGAYADMNRIIPVAVEYQSIEDNRLPIRLNLVTVGNVFV